MSWKGKWVKVEKAYVSEDPLVRTPREDEYEPGAINFNMSVPTGYTILGLMNCDLATAVQLAVVRYERNGVEAAGLFTSSRIKEWQEMRQEDGTPLLVVKTENSIYWITESPEAEAKYGAVHSVAAIREHSSED